MSETIHGNVTTFEGRQAYIAAIEAKVLEDHARIAEGVLRMQLAQLGIQLATDHLIAQVTAPLRILADEIRAADGHGRAV